MGDAEWNCAEVPEWKQESCCPYCHHAGERSFSFQVAGTIKRLCCKFSMAFIKLHTNEEIIFLDPELLLTSRP